MATAARRGAPTACAAASRTGCPVPGTPNAVAGVVWMAAATVAAGQRAHGAWSSSTAAPGWPASTASARAVHRRPARARHATDAATERLAGLAHLTRRAGLVDAPALAAPASIRCAMRASAGLARATGSALGRHRTATPALAPSAPGRASAARMPRHAWRRPAPADPTRPAEETRHCAARCWARLRRWQRRGIGFR